MVAVVEQRNVPISSKPRAERYAASVSSRYGKCGLAGRIGTTGDAGRQTGEDGRERAAIVLTLSVSGIRDDDVSRGDSRARGAAAANVAGRLRFTTLVGFGGGGCGGGRCSVVIGRADNLNADATRPAAALRIKLGNCAITLRKRASSSPFDGRAERRSLSSTKSGKTVVMSSYTLWCSVDNDQG